MKYKVYINIEDEEGDSVLEELGIPVERAVDELKRFEKSLEEGYTPKGEGVWLN